MFFSLRWNFSLLLIGFVKSDNSMQQVIKAFVDLHTKGCHIVLFTYSKEFYEQRLLLDFHKAVMKNNYIPTVFEDIENRMNNAVSTRKRCNRPIRSFIMGNVSYIAKYMIEEKQKEDIRRDMWLLFIANDFDQELIISQVQLSMRSEVYIAKRTENGFEFWEVYQPSKNSLIRIIYYGNWTSETGLRVTRLPVLERRRNFGGAVLRAPTYARILNTRSEQNEHVKLLEIVLRLLAKELNFTIELINQSDNGLEYLSSENVTDNIRMLDENEVDISIMERNLLSNIKSIDYSGPIALTHFRVYMKKVETEFESGSQFLNPLPELAWYIAILIAVVLPVIILLMYHIGRKAGLIKTQYKFLDLCFTLHQIFCLQGGALHEELFSVSLISVFINLWAFLIRSIYSASLASSLAIEQYAAPFDSLKELLENGQYEFGVHRYSSAFHLYYKTNDHFLMKLNKAVMEQNISKLPKTYLEGFERVCSGKKYAFMASTIKVLELDSKISCKLHFLPHEKYTLNTVFAVSRHNEYLSFINRWLMVLNEAGFMSKFKHDIMEGLQPYSDDSQSVKSVEFNDILFLQHLFTIGVVLSILILSAEILYSKMRGHQRARDH